jgi:hypothetical protein
VDAKRGNAEALKLTMFVRSIERLAQMAKESGHVVVNDDGIWQKAADGSPLQFTDGIGRKYSPRLPRATFDDWRKQRFISSDMSAPAEQGLVLRLTRVGLEQGLSAR